jgi:hypothetical protein
MRKSISVACAAAAAAFVLAAVPARAQLDTISKKCVEGYVKEASKFVQKKGKTIAKCNDKNLKEPGACPQLDLDADIAALEQKFRDGIAKKCPDQPDRFAALGFPGKCSDANPGNGFTLADLQECLVTTHEDAVDDMIDVEYGTTTGPIVDKDVLKCQATIGKESQKYAVAVLKAVQKCRNGLAAGKLFGFAPADCRTADPKTAQAATKAESKLRAAVLKKCTDAHIASLDVCNPNATTVAEAQDCLVESHLDEIDSTDPVDTDLIDVEYRQAGSCGDGVRNGALEECDAANPESPDDAECPGACGSPNGFFACFCMDSPRQRVIEHSNTDLDNGWTGISHDSGIVEGGGYIADLYDCDEDPMTMGADFDDVCTVGPSCSGSPHAACTSNAQCAMLGQGTCRRTLAATGPHCHLNPETPCTSNLSCPASGDFCVFQYHGAPLPLSAGGVSVCVINIFSENVVGTTNLVTGEGAVRLRQRSHTFLGGSNDQPCPTCGGWCLAPGGDGSTPGDRTPCTTNADCENAPNVCVTAKICSYGANQDQPCRTDPPFGGGTDVFGTASLDCPPIGGNNFPPQGGSLISGAGLDILFNPASTGQVTLVPNVQCSDFTFSGSACVGGTNDGRTCTAASDCPGGGTCNEQCFCPNTAQGTAQKPNSCNPACRGGANEGLLCGNDTDCPGGFCQNASCRPNMSDTDSFEEGVCPSGPSQGLCSVHYFKSCQSDAECAAPFCPTCDPGETCITSLRQCFVNSGIRRAGAPGVPDRTTAAIFCIAGIGGLGTSVSQTAGLPGPGAITTPTTTLTIGF